MSQEEIVENMSVLPAMVLKKIISLSPLSSDSLFIVRNIFKNILFSLRNPGIFHFCSNQNSGISLLISAKPGSSENFLMFVFAVFYKTISTLV